MIKIFIIGSGKIANALVSAFLDTQVEIVGIFSTNTKTGKNLSNIAKCKFYTQIEKVNALADVYFLAVPDSQISLVQTKLKTNGIVAHCSGLTHINILNNAKNVAVFWPVQSFSLGVKYNFKNIPICIEANTDDNLRVMEQLAYKISEKVYLIDSEKRQFLHLAAVFANNFTNHLYAIANKIADDKNFDFNILKPLIFETSNKLNTITPKQAQTGPALRGDVETLSQHIELLKKQPEFRQLYELLSLSISKHNS